MAYLDSRVVQAYPCHTDIDETQVLRYGSSGMHTYLLAAQIQNDSTAYSIALGYDARRATAFAPFADTKICRPFATTYAAPSGDQSSKNPKSPPRITFATDPPWARDVRNSGCSTSYYTGTLSASRHISDPKTNPFVRTRTLLTARTKSGDLQIGIAVAANVYGESSFIAQPIPKRHMETYIVEGSSQDGPVSGTKGGVVRATVSHAPPGYLHRTSTGTELEIRLDIDEITIVGAPAYALLNVSYMTMDPQDAFTNQQWVDPDTQLPLASVLHPLPVYRQVAVLSVVPGTDNPSALREIVLADLGMRNVYSVAIVVDTTVAQSLGVQTGIGPIGPGFGVTELYYPVVPCTIKGPHTTEQLEVLGPATIDSQMFATTGLSNIISNTGALKSQRGMSLTQVGNDVIAYSMRSSPDEGPKKRFT